MEFFIFSAVLTVVSATTGSELVPERYLRPRDFNPHPFTDINEGGAAKQISLPDVHPYAILASKRPREGPAFPEQDAVVYPNPPAAVLPRKPAIQVHLQPGNYENDPYNNIPKNYAFSYSVRDKNSGDDFSHSQAHNGKATRGQYRVKLPDGRVQVVSYTADHKGYRADVQYEGAPTHYQQPTPIYEHTTPAPPQSYAHQAPQHYIQHSYPPTSAPYYQQHYIQNEPTYTATPAPYQQQEYSPTPGPYHTEQAYSPTPAPYQQQEFSPSPASYHQEQAYSPTPAPYHQEQAYSPTPASYHQEQAYSPTPASYRQEHGYSPSPAPYQQQHIVSATPAPYAYSPTPTTYNEYNPTQGYQTILYNPQHSYQSQSAQPQVYASPSPAPESNFASPSPITFPTSPPEQQTYQQTPGLQAYASHSESPYPTPEYESYASPSASAFAVQPHLRSTPAPFARHQFVTSTERPRIGHILVTPRTQRNANKNASRRVFDARDHIVYRFKSPA